MSNPHITKIHCRNFRAFQDREIADLEPGRNILIGDNDNGKSSILLALGRSAVRLEWPGQSARILQALTAHFRAKFGTSIPARHLTDVNGVALEIGKRDNWPNSNN